MTEINFADALPGFQPIVDVARGIIVGYEVLARRENKDRGLETLGHLFYGGQIPSRDLLALDRCIRQQAIDRLGELPQGFLSLNISPDWINQLTGWTTTPLLQMLERNQVDPARVVLEITEQQGSIEAMKRVVRRYRKAGCRVAIDDFGAGNSHMHRIMELEPDILKLDMKLFKNAANGGQHYDLVHSVSRLAEKTGCQLVCEGVETLQEFAFGLELGAAWMQGFLFAPAQRGFSPADRFSVCVANLRRDFLRHKVMQQRSRYRFEERTLAVLQDLREQCHALPEITDAHLATLAVAPDSAVLKFYLCNAEGTQVSSNIEFEPDTISAPGGLRVNPLTIGMNWCWRPHFYQLLAARETQSQEFVASSLYRDVGSRQLCRSYVTRLYKGLYLLVDVAQPDTDSSALPVTTL